MTTDGYSPLIESLLSDPVSYSETLAEWSRELLTEQLPVLISHLVLKSVENLERQRRERQLRTHFECVYGPMI